MSNAPRFLKGAIVVVDPANPIKELTIAFQYNPETLKRTLTPQMANSEKGQRAETLRFLGAPEETFTIEIVIDATDQLEKGEAQAREMGIYPQLSALEILLYPNSQQVINDNKLLDQGKIEIGGGPYDAPLTLFVWGPKRVLPIMLTSVSVSETIFDTKLNPIQATVSLSAKALSYSDLDPKHKGYSLFMAYQKVKENMASALNTGSSNQAVGFNVGTFIAKNSR
jgi:hypothetical protein